MQELTFLIPSIAIDHHYDFGLPHVATERPDRHKQGRRACLGIPLQSWFHLMWGWEVIRHIVCTTRKLDPTYLL